MTGFGGGDGGADGLQVTHFTDENGVGVLTQGASDGVGESRHVVVDFALRDDGILVVVVELDGVFDGDDMVFLLDVDDVDHGGERRRFAGTGRSRDEDEATRAEEDVFHGVWQADLGHGQQVVRDGTHDDTDIASGLEDGDTETAAVAEGETEVDGTVLLELLLVRLGGDGLHEVFTVFGREGGAVQLRHFAVDSEDGRRQSVDVKVAGALFEDEVQQVCHFIMWHNLSYLNKKGQRFPAEIT